MSSANAMIWNRLGIHCQLVNKFFFVSIVLFVSWLLLKNLRDVACLKYTL